MPGKPTQISQRERQVLTALWGLGPSTGREILRRLRNEFPDMAYSTVKTFLRRLEDKGLVRCDRGNFTHVFSAATSPDELVVKEVEALADRIGSGTFPLVRALVERAEFTDREVAELEALMKKIAVQEKRR